LIIISEIPAEGCFLCQTGEPKCRPKSVGFFYPKIYHGLSYFGIEIRTRGGVSLFHAINYVLDLGPGNVYWPKLSNSALATEEPQLTDFFLPISGPSGSPEFLSDKISTSSTSLSVVWQPPTRSTLNGEFLGYEMTYKVAGASDGRNAKRIRINEDMLRIQVREEGS
jgi:hypothetical protein